jgi:hypothetical protein
MEALLAEISRYELLKEEPPADPALALPRGEEPELQPPQVDSLAGDVRRPDARPNALESFFADTKQPHPLATTPRRSHPPGAALQGNKMLAEFVGCETVDGHDCPHCGQKAKG